MRQTLVLVALAVTSMVALAFLIPLGLLSSTTARESAINDASAEAVALAPVLAANGGGAFVNVLSVASWIGSPRLATYSASKSAAWGFTNAARIELKLQGTQVVGVHVGYMDTDMTADVTAPKSEPADLVVQVIEALEKGDEEVLGDETSRFVKSVLSGPPAQLVL